MWLRDQRMRDVHEWLENAASFQLSAIRARWKMMPNLNSMWKMRWWARAWNTARKKRTATRNAQRVRREHFAWIPQCKIKTEEGKRTNRMKTNKPRTYVVKGPAVNRARDQYQYQNQSRVVWTALAQKKRKMNKSISQLNFFNNIRPKSSSKEIIEKRASIFSKMISSISSK